MSNVCWILRPRIISVEVFFKKNHTLIVVEHDMTFIDAISEKVTVLANGAILAEGTLNEVQNNEAVIETYLGR